MILPLRTYEKTKDFIEKKKKPYKFTAASSESLRFELLRTALEF